MHVSFSPELQHREWMYWNCPAWAEGSSSSPAAPMHPWFSVDHSFKYRIRLLCSSFPVVTFSELLREGWVLRHVGSLGVLWFHEAKNGHGLMECISQERCRMGARDAAYVSLGGSGDCSEQFQEPTDTFSGILHTIC